MIYRLRIILSVVLSLLGISLLFPSHSYAQDSNYSQGVTKDQILIGHLGPETGPLAIYDQFRMGIQSYFNYVNKNGGVSGRKLKLVAYDDQYQPAKTVQLTKRLTESDKVFAILDNVCTSCNVAALPSNKKSGIPVVMVGSGSTQFVNPPISNYMGSSIINYGFEAKILVDYIVNRLHKTRVVLTYQNDDYGTPLADIAETLLKTFKGVSFIGRVAYNPGDTDLSPQAQKIKSMKPEAILTFSGPASAARLKKALYAIGVKKPTYLVSSVAGDTNTMFDLAGKDVWEGSISTAVMPKPGMDNSEKMQAYVKQFKSDYPEVDAAGWGQTGWASAQVLVEALRRTKNLTWNSFLHSFYTFNNWQGSLYSGVTFSPTNHYGLTSLFMTQAKAGKIVPISEAYTFDPANGSIAGGAPLH